MGVELPSLDRLQHGAARLALVLAVPEAAALGEVEHVLERPLDALAAGPQADGPQAGRVDDPTATGETDQLGRGRGVPASVVLLANRARVLDRPADQAVHERRLPDSARAQQRD